ncbi:unnamed protein product [Mytilus edulis]|uniref:Integrase p58-like C-terminal domain-containing protein n=1 Tax=Mytilus edulis TaxID=6550 RepID=A0A8S3V7I8_MYTED|nr:unnamed protein product [Mytilus edulis]
MIIKGVPCGPVIFNEVGIVETNRSFIEKTGLLLARVVVQPNSNIIPLRVANFSSEPVKVYKNTIVGTFEPVDLETYEVSTVSRVNCADSNTKVDIPDHLKGVFEKSSKDLDNIEVKKLREFLCSYQDVFSKSPSDIGHTELVNHKINTGNAKPIKLKPYRLPLAKREVAEKEIQDMASRGIIEPSSSAWCSPVVMVTKKKDQSIRFCIDFRKINDITEKDSQPIPRIEDTLDALSGREVEINNEILTKEVVVKSVVVDDTNTLTGAVRVEGSQRIETSKKPKVAQLYASYRSDDLNASKSCTKHENERVNISDKVKDESGFVSKASHDARKSSSSHTFNVPNLKRSEKIKGKRGFAGETSVDVCKSKTHENIINQRVGVVKTRSMKPNPLDQQKPSSSSPMHDEQFVEMDFDLENEQENDPVLKIIRDWLVNNLKPIWSEISKFSPIIKYFWNRIESFEIRDGIICRKWESEKGDNVTWQKVIPENLKEGVLKQLHNSVTGGHLGIKKTLSKDWDKFVPILMMAYRSAEHESTGVSPCKMMYGREINLPVDLLFGKSPDSPKSSISDFVNDLEHTLLTVHEFARTNLNVASDVMKRNYDHNIHLKLFNPGDPVWYYQYQRKVGVNPKFQRPWHGPFVVTHRLNDVLYRIQLGPRMKPKVVHHDKLKPYLGDHGPIWFS